MLLAAHLDDFHPPVDPSPLVPATGWLAEDPACWPVFLYMMGGSTAAVDAFDVDAGELDAMLATMERLDQWPVFTVDLGAGNRVHLVLRNFDGDLGLDYLLTGSWLDGYIRLASIEGSFFGPAFTWPEIIAASQRPDEDLSPAERLLLLLPGMSDEAMPHDATEIVADAVTAVGGRRRQREIADGLLRMKNGFWGHTAWSESGGVPVDVGRYATRGTDLPLRERKLIAEALAGKG